MLATLATAASPAVAQGNGRHPGPGVYPAHARPYGASIATWGERASQWVYGTPYERSPLFDDTGANCAVNQRGPVWYIARIAGPAVFEGTRRCTIPRQKAILLYIGAVVSTYPCAADPAFRPQPGQRLYDFLAADADAAMDTVDHLSVTIDGRPVRRVLEDHRHVSRNLFSIKGHSSMQTAFDPCITGRRQAAVMDGFFLMLEPLDRGVHTVRVHGTNTIGHNKTFNYILTIV